MLLKLINPMRRNKIFRRTRFEFDLRDKYTEYLHNMQMNDRIALINKFIEKHKDSKDSDVWIISFLKRIINSYAYEYGEKLVTDEWSNEKKYLIDDCFEVTMEYFINKSEIRYATNEAFLKVIKDDYVIVYSPDDKEIGSTNNILSFYDFLAQIREKKLEGYYAVYKEKKIRIVHNGTLEEYPDGLFDKYTNIMFRLV